MKTDSTLLSAGDAGQIASWMNKRNWRLLYRMTRDGLNASTCHSKIDNQGPTVTVVKSKETGRVFGGYASVAWNTSRGGTKDENAFLYGFPGGV